MSDGEQASLDIQVGDDISNGVFADFVAVWHNPYGFTLDFGVMGLPQPQPDGPTTVPTPIVARVKVPPGLIFQIAQAIADNVDKYEKAYGAITPRPADGESPS